MLPYKTVLIYIPFNLLASPYSTEDGIGPAEPLQTGEMVNLTLRKVHSLPLSLCQPHLSTTNAMHRVHRCCEHLWGYP